MLKEKQVMMEFQGEKEKLFRLNFGRLFIESSNVRLLDYGFLWRHVYDTACFDDITWWLLEKR